MQWTCPPPLPHLPASSLPLSSSLLLLSLPHCPSIPQVLASLRTVRSNFTILANVTTPTNKSVSCCQTPLPPPHLTCHDCLLRLQCVYTNVSVSLIPWGNTLVIMINQFMMTRQCSRNMWCALFGIFPASFSWRLSAESSVPQVYVPDSVPRRWRQSITLKLFSLVMQ